MTRAGALLTLLAPLLVVGAANARAADAQAADPLTRQDLPSVAAVATVYPDLAGGQRDVLATGTFDANAGNDCVAIRTLGTPRRALWASYYTADGADPYFHGGESVTPFLHRFADQRQARVLMSRLGSYFERCAGRHRSEDGTRTRLTELPVPGLADATLAYQVRFRHPTGNGTSVPRSELHVVVRDGRTVVNVMLQARRFVPDLEHAVAVARLALESSSS